MAATFDDVVDELKKGVKLADTANILAAANGVIMGHIATASRAAAMGHGGSGSGPGGGGGRATAPQQQPGFFGRLFNQSAGGRGFYGTQGRAGRLMGGTGPKGTAGLGGGAAGIAKGAGAVGAVVAVVAALNEMRKAIQKASEAALAAARKYGEVSGPMAEVFARKDVQDMLRDRQIGDQTAGSTGRLADSVSRRQDAAAPFEIATTNAKNAILSWFEDKIADSMERFRVMGNKVIEVLTLGAEKDFFGKLSDGGLGAYDKALVDAAAEGKKLDGRRLADIAAATAGRAGGRGLISAPAGMRPPGMLP